MQPLPDPEGRWAAAGEVRRTQHFNRQPDLNCAGVAQLIVKWKISPFMPPDEPDLVVWVNVGQVDKMWAATDPDFYVSAGGGGHTKPGSYARVGKAISQGEIMEMPQLSLDGSTLSFSDGRHRFAWCRDHGITALPVLAPPDCAEDLMKAVGENVPNPTDYRSMA